MAHLAGRLEQEGVISCRADPADASAPLLRATAEGERTVVERAKADWLSAALPTGTMPDTLPRPAAAGSDGRGPPGGLAMS